MACSLPVLDWCVIRGFIYLRHVTASLTFRAATPDDAEPLARAVADGLEIYRSFAGDDWGPPPAEEEAGHVRALLADPDVWCRVAEAGGEIVGQVTVVPAAKAGRPVDDPALAHLSNIFVRADLWGTGLSRTLHAAALDAARERGFTSMRLFCAAGQARARRFYEREGWETVGEPWHEAALGLDMVEYRRAL
jgi:GNAT superfamily N-acetyltransferase